MEHTRSFGWRLGFVLMMAILVLGGGVGCASSASNPAVAYLASLPESRRVVVVQLDRLRHGDMRGNMVISDGDELVLLSDASHAAYRRRMGLEGQGTTALPVSRVTTGRWQTPAQPPLLPSDRITVTVYELHEPGVDHIQTLQIPEDGVITIDLLGPVSTVGLDSYELENVIRVGLEDARLLRAATVGVIVQSSPNRVFTVVDQAGARRAFAIPKPDTRLLEAIDIAGVQEMAEVDVVCIVKR